MRVTEAATVYIADSPRDVEAARIGGARSIAVASGRASTAELRDAGAGAVLPDLTDPAALISPHHRLTRAHAECALGPARVVDMRIRQAWPTRGPTMLVP